jgi:hypothetical protein
MITRCLFIDILQARDTEPLIEYYANTQFSRLAQLQITFSKSRAQNKKQSNRSEASNYGCRKISFFSFAAYVNNKFAGYLVNETDSTRKNGNANMLE